MCMVLLFCFYLDYSILLKIGLEFLNFFKVIPIKEVVLFFNLVQHGHLKTWALNKL